MIIYSLLIIGLMLTRPQGLFTFGGETGPCTSMSAPLLELDKRHRSASAGSTAVGDLDLRSRSDVNWSA